MLMKCVKLINFSPPCFGTYSVNCSVLLVLHCYCSICRCILNTMTWKLTTCTYVCEWSKTLLQSVLMKFWWIQYMSVCGNWYHLLPDITYTHPPHTTTHLSFLLGARGMEEAGSQLLRERESPLLKPTSRSVSRGSSSSGLAAFSLSVPDMAGMGGGEGSLQPFCLNCMLST